MKFERFVLALLIVATLAVPLWAQDSAENEEPVKTLDAMTVRGTEIDGQVPSYVDNIVDEEELSIPTTGDSVLGALKNTAGVQIQRASLTSAESRKVRLRGFDESRFRVLMNGMPVNRDGSYGCGPIDWSMFSTESMKRIEITRGAGPAKYGNTLGGTINIVTKEPKEKATTSVTGVVGSRETYDFKGFHSASAGPLSFALSASHFETDGYLRNNDNERNNVNVRLGYELPKGFKLGGGLYLSDSDTGMAVYNMPGSPYFDASKPQASQREMGGPGVTSRLKKGVLAWGDGSRIEDRNTMLDFNLSKEYEKGKATITAMQWYQERTEFFKSAEDPSRTVYQRKTEAEDGNWQMQGDASYQLGDHLVEAGGEFRKMGWGDQVIENMDKSEFTGAMNILYYIKEGFKGQNRCLEYWAGYVQDSWKINKKVEIQGGLRYEDFTANEIDPDAFGFDAKDDMTPLNEENLDPRLTVIYHPWEASALTARINRVHRYPTSPEYFWWYLNKSSGYFNTTLDAEESWQYEAEYMQTFFGRFDALIRYYYNDVENYLSSTSVQGVGTVVYNIDEVTIRGVEAELGLRLPYATYLWSNFTWQEAEKSGDPWDEKSEITNQLPYLPERMINAGVDFDGVDRLSLKLWMNFVGDREDYNGTEVKKMGSYTLLNASASYTIMENKLGKWEALLSAENIADADYEEESGYNMPGSSWIGGLRASF